MSKTALITGITGQDGSYLAEYLLNLNYKVCGIIRRQSVADNQTNRIDYLDNDLNLYYGDLTDEYSIYKIISETKPDEVYNLGAMSHVRVSFDIPSFTIKTNSLGTLNVLESVKNLIPACKVYQASSSEMFGNSVDDSGYQKISTPMNPVSPYGVSKLMAYNLVKQYRNGYKIHACNGILFNHESPRRGTTFVTNKVVKTAVEIKYGVKDKLELGNLDSYRDWGHSYDYVRAMHMILNYQIPKDWIVSTGKSKSVRDLCMYTFKQLSLNYEDYVVQNPKYFRKEEVNYLKGDSSEIREILGWSPKYTFETMIDEMIEFWEKKISNKKLK
jgi:GDPmannose 4,6-dehydratase